MEPMPTATESIEDFFGRYTGHLTAGDIEALAAIYNYPSLAVTAMGCLAITDPQQTRDFFSQGQHFYRNRGIHGLRARDIVTDVEVPGIWVGRLVLENLDEDGAAVGIERNAYQIVTTSDGTRRIAVSTPLDAYNPRSVKRQPTAKTANCGVTSFGDPLAVLDHDRLDAVKSHPRHEGVSALQPFGALAVVLEKPGGLEVLADGGAHPRGRGLADRVPKRAVRPAPSWT
jgi:hypothetical protein